MGRPPSNGGPAFRFNLPEVTEMEAILLQHNKAMPGRHILEALAEKFSESVERKGKVVVQFKQIWNWFQNRRYALRARGNKTPGKLNVSSMPRAVDPANQMRNVLQPLAVGPKPTHMSGNLPAMTPVPSGILVPGVMRSGSDNSYLEFEAKSGRDGAWYDVQAFLAHRNLEIGDPEVYNRNPKEKKKEVMESSDHDMSFSKIMKDVDLFGNSHMTWKDRKALEDKKVTALGGKPQKKQRLPLSVARVQMKKQKEREEKMLEHRSILGRFGGQVGGVSTKKPAERKRKPEDRVLKSTEGNFRSGVLDVRHLLHSGSSRTNDRDTKTSKRGGEEGCGGRKSKGKKKGKKKGGNKRKGK